MAFIIDKKGNKVHVDMEVDYFSQTCALYADEAKLVPIWLVKLYKGKDLGDGSTEPILIKQVEYRKKPTKDELMTELWKVGLSRYDFVIVEKGYQLDW